MPSGFIDVGMDGMFLSMLFYIITNSSGWYNLYVTSSINVAYMHAYLTIVKHNCVLNDPYITDTFEQAYANDHKGPVDEFPFKVKKADDKNVSKSKPSTIITDNGDSAPKRRFKGHEQPYCCVPSIDRGKECQRSVCSRRRSYLTDNNLNGAIHEYRSGQILYRLLYI